ANSYLRERSQVFDRLNAQMDAPIESQDTDNEKTEEEENIWTPTPYIESPVDMDTVNSEIITNLNRLKESKSLDDEKLIDKMITMFWKIVSDQSILQQRINKAKNVIIKTHTENQNLKQNIADSIAQHEQEIRALKDEHKQEILKLKQQILYEKSS